MLLWIAAAADSCGLTLRQVAKVSAFWWPHGQSNDTARLYAGHMCYVDAISYDI